MSNGYGNVQVDRYRDMATYDEAPPPLRWLMRNAVGLWSAPHMVEGYWHLRQQLDHGNAMRVILDGVRRSEIEGTLEAYGPTHPEARPVMHEAAA